MRMHCPIASFHTHLPNSFSAADCDEDYIRLAELNEQLGSQRGFDAAEARRDLNRCAAHAVHALCAVRCVVLCILLLLLLLLGLPCLLQSGWPYA